MEKENILFALLSNDEKNLFDYLETFSIVRESEQIIFLLLKNNKENPDSFLPYIYFLFVEDKYYNLKDEIDLLKTNYFDKIENEKIFLIASISFFVCSFGILLTLLYFLF